MMVRGGGSDARTRGTGGAERRMKYGKRELFLEECCVVRNIMVVVSKRM